MCLTRPLAISIVWVKQGLGAHEQGPTPPTRCSLSLVPEIDLGLCWAMPSSSRAGQAGGGPDLGYLPLQFPAATAPHRALTDLRTPSPHPLGPAALGGLQSPGGFLTGACPSTPPRFMQFEAEDEIRMANVSCTMRAQGTPPLAPPMLAPQEPTSHKWALSL